MTLKEFLVQTYYMDKDLDILFINEYGEMSMVRGVKQLTEEEIGDPDFCSSAILISEFKSTRNSI